jgi:aspartate/methionine/tyrosine aminotransferase
MRGDDDLLARSWEERDVSALLAHRFGMFEIDELAEDLERTYDDVVRLTLAKSELPVHPAISEAMVAAVRDGKRSTQVYPLGVPALREAVADYEGQAYGRNVDPASVVISTGSGTIIRNLCCLLAHNGGEVLLPRPYCPLYLYSAALAGAQVSFYDVDVVTGCIDFASLRAGLTGATRIVILNAPGNPLGNRLTMADLRLADEAVDGRAVIVSDEIYRNVSFDDDVPSMGALTEPRSPIVVTSSFSKGFRMYSRRVGYTVVPEEFTRPLAAMADHLLLTTDPVPQYGAVEALRHPEEVDELRAAYAGRRDYALKRLAEVPSIRPVRGEGGFCLTVDVSAVLGEDERPDSGELVGAVAPDRMLAESILAEAHVAAVPGSDFGMPGALRLSYCSGQFENAVDRLARYLEEHA